MNIDRPRLAIGTFSVTLAVAMMGMALLPSPKVKYAFRASWLGQGYLTIWAYDINENRRVDLRLLRAHNKDGGVAGFTNPGPGVWRFPKSGPLILKVEAAGQSRTLNVSPPDSAMAPVVENQGPMAFLCEGMGFMVVPMEGVSVIGLDNPFMVLIRQASGALSPVLPKGVKLVFKSSGKRRVLDFRNGPVSFVDMPVQPTRPLTFEVFIGARRACRYTYYLDGRAKGMVMDQATVVLDPARPQFHARIRVLDPPMGLHCLAYERQDLRLQGPVAYRYFDIRSTQAKLNLELPAREGFYYVLCTPDPVTPLYYYVRRNVVVGHDDAAKMVRGLLSAFSMPEKDRATVISLLKQGLIGESVHAMGSRIPDLLPPVTAAASTLERDSQTRRQKHDRAATVLMILIGTAFAGITLWLVMVSIRQGRGLRQALAEEGQDPGIRWGELALFVLINLVNVATLLYTLYLVIF